MPKKLYSNGEIEDWLGEIWAGKVTPIDLPEDLINETFEYLRSGLYKGFGAELSDLDEGKPLELLTNLRENIYDFSVARSFQMTLEMSDAISDEETGKSFSKFKQAAADIYAKYNGGDYLQASDKAGYLHTEYDTVIASGQNAERWQQIEEQADVNPYVIFSAVEDANTTEECIAENGMCAPVDDPIWDSYTPPLHFNCRSGLLTTDDKSEVTPKAKYDELVEHLDKEVPDIFKNNSGKSGQVFNDKHPYFSVPKAYQKEAAGNWGLEVPDED